MVNGAEHNPHHRCFASQALVAYFKDCNDPATAGALGIPHGFIMKIRRNKD